VGRLTKLEKLLKPRSKRLAQRLGFGAAPKRKGSASAEAALRLSLVVPTYNVEAYIDRFLASVFNQSSQLKSFEVIIVDDGSTDRSAEIAKEWQARHPRHVRYVYQENAGLCAARNTGLALARGTWVSFPDPDDFLDVNFVRKMLKETEAEHEFPLLAVASNYVFYIEDTDEFRDTHPLRFRFRKGTVRKNTNDLGDHMQLAANSCWVRRDAILRSNLTFDQSVVPAFEDAHFLNKLFIASPNMSICFVPSARYYYRKRSDRSSLQDTSKWKKEWYIDQIQNGILDLIRFSRRELGFVPRHVQRLCLYDLFWRFRHVVNHDERIAFLSTGEQGRFVELVGEVMSFISDEVIEDFTLAGCTEEHRVALLGLFKEKRREEPAIYLQQIDPVAGMVQFAYYTGGDDWFRPRVIVNGEEARPTLSSQTLSEFVGVTYFRSNLFWVSMQDGDEIAFEVDGKACRIRRLSASVGSPATWLDLRTALVPPTPIDLDEETSRLRAHVTACREQYRGCYVLMDRDDKADDNAEHLYRHMMRTGRIDNAWFALSRASVDWDRLEAEGFRLLPFGSDDHIAAQMNAAMLISSHADEHILWPASRSGFSDIARYEFIFLQHGVILNDLSDWLNHKPIRVFVTTMPAEAEAIATPSGRYKFSPREVLLSGLPRHDELLKLSSNAVGDSILIIPTWRKYLTDETSRSGMERGKIAGFTESAYFSNWASVIHSANLRLNSERRDLKIRLALHPNISMYCDEFDIPPWIEVVDVRTVSYQSLFAQAVVAITDYSSAASEVAYLQRPVIYFQFDSNEMFGGGHVCKSGYFSYRDHGFGPVVDRPEDVVARVEDALAGRLDPVYAARSAAAFPFRDGGCCERVCEAIERLAEPRPSKPPLYVTTDGRAISVDGSGSKSRSRPWSGARDSVVALRGGR
jgi:glycosyltransferase involved in cell wall biosynthesis